MIMSTFQNISFLAGQAGQAPNMSVVLAVIIGFLSMMFIFFVFIARVVKCSPNKVLIVTGGFGKRRVWDAFGKVSLHGFRIIRSGATFVFPLIQRIDQLSLELVSLDIRIPMVYTLAAVPVEVIAVAQIKIKSDDISISTAAEYFLSKSVEEISNFAMQAIEADVRSVFSTMSEEEMRSKRSVLVEKVQEVASKDLANMGLAVISFMIRDIRQQGLYSGKMKSDA
jgi:flotillin